MARKKIITSLESYIKFKFDIFLLKKKKEIQEKYFKSIR